MTSAVIMLKWLVNVTGQEGETPNDDIQNKITDDPLATIKISGKRRQEKVYSVNRWKQDMLKFISSMINKNNISDE